MNLIQSPALSEKVKPSTLKYQKRIDKMKLVHDEGIFTEAHNFDEQSLDPSCDNSQDSSNQAAFNRKRYGESENLHNNKIHNFGLYLDRWFLETLQYLSNYFDLRKTYR